MMQVDIELKELHNLTLEMCQLVLRNITNSFKAFKGGEYILINDDEVDEFERCIEEKCLDILVKERIFASDLKIVTGILKLISDLERIADHSVDIMTFNKKLIKTNFKLEEDVLGMIELCNKMTVNSITSFINKDVKLAEETIKLDDTVDKIYKNILKTMINEENQDEQYISVAIYKTLVVKYIERISDHAVNIAEWVIYIVNGYHKSRQIY